MVKTEDTGKQFEMAICLAYGISFIGNYKYGMELPYKLKTRLSKLVTLFPACRHTAGKTARYDFTTTDGTMHLSAKTTKKGTGKVAPQVIGQAQPKKFYETVGFLGEYTDVLDLKQRIQTEPSKVLTTLVEHTFDCPNIYYNQERDTIRYIVLNKQIDWSGYEYTWSRKWEEWTNSTTLKLNGVSLVEFQFHSKSRTNMAIRWNYENFLAIFRNNLTISNL